MGQWKVLGFSHKKYKQGNVLVWKCQCSCGSVRWKTTGNLKDPQQQRCSACASPERNKKRIKYARPFEPLFQRLHLSSKNKGLMCSLTYEEFFEFTRTIECEYCGANVKWSLSSQAMSTNMDRKDNAKGYSKDNCAVCCIDCNRIKSNRFTYTQMLEIGSLIKKWRLDEQRRKVQTDRKTKQTIR